MRQALVGLTGFSAFQIAVNDGRNLSAGRMIRGHEIAVGAIDQAFAAGPLQSRDGVFTDRECVIVAEDVGVLPHGDVAALVLGIAIQDGSQQMSCQLWFPVRCHQ